MNKASQILVKHGLAIMLTGFGILVAGLLVLVVFNRVLHSQYSEIVIKPLSYSVTALGFVMYACGRVGVSLQRKIDRKKSLAEKPEKDRA
jgi:hypothetical protein